MLCEVNAVFGTNGRSGLANLASASESVRGTAFDLNFSAILSVTEFLERA